MTVSGHSGTDLTLSSATLTSNALTFTTANWATAQTVTVKAAEDDDGVTDADVTLAHAISSDDDTDYNALANQSVTVSITENDVVGVTINPTTLTVTEGDATGVEYTVVLTSKPAGDVTVTVSGHSGTDLSISGTSLSNDGKLTFTTDNWATAQTVTVKAAEDDDGVTDTDVTLAHAISSDDDTDYNALANQSVTVSITENDVVGVTISPTTLTVAEGDATGVEYTVVLTSKPAGDVTVTVSGHSGTDLTLSGTTLTSDALTFTTANWATAQTVTVKAAEDDDGVTDADVTLTHAISSADDTDYDALADQSVTVSITEDDAVGVTINPTTLTVAEGDATGVDYTVVLTSKPAGDVIVAISGHASTDVSLTGTGLSNDNKLTFTTANWNTAQTVTVKAAEDDDGVTDTDVTLAHAISSDDDTDYNALANQSVTVSITENDVVGVTISPTTLTVTEGDATGVDYTVVLTSKPAGDVIVAISGHASTDVSITGTGLSNDGKLTFTTATWGTAQTVTVKAAEDDDGVTDADVTLAHAISSADDTDYNALANQSVTVSITENDEVGVTINPTTLTVAEGDSTGVDYTVVLTSKPAGDVTVTVSGHSGTDLTLSGTTLTSDALTFTTANWATAQTVTVKAAEDDDGVTDADVTLTHAISSADDTDYNALANQSVTVSITENDEVGVTVTVSFEKDVHYTIEGASGAAGVEVWLSAPLQSEVTIPITVLSQSTASPEDYVMDDSPGYPTDPGLTFSPGETFGYVFVMAALDTVDENTETVVLGFGTLPAGVTEGSANRSTVEIEDAVQVSFADSTYMVEEGGPGVEVKVKLNKPGDNVIVPLTANGQGGADDSDFSGVPQELIFKSDETEKTFTVTAMPDTEEENGELVRLSFGTFSEGIVAVDPDSAMVMIEDDDRVTVTVSFEKEFHYTIEGASGAAGVEVWLSAPLQSEVTIPITVLSQSTASPEDYVMDDSPGYPTDPGLTFSPGETFGYVFVMAALDTVDENTETVVLGFGTLPAGVTEGSSNRSTVEIRDAIQVSFADSTYIVQEGGPGVEVMVKLNKPGDNVIVPLTANGQGGADDSDFTGVPQELIFKSDETEKTFMVTAMADTEEENGELVRLGFGSFSEGIVAVDPDSATVSITEGAGAPAPRQFSANWPTQTSLTLIWYTVETAAEYKLEYRKNGETDWTRIRGNFDHLPSKSDQRQAFGVAAGLECGTLYEFQLRARSSGEERNNGNRYAPHLGSAATTSARTGECAQEEEITNLLVSIEPDCATLTWTRPSGNRDTGYRVERYSYSYTDNRNQRSEPETLVEQANPLPARFQDCSAKYRMPGADHVYIVTALDNDPGPDEDSAFGSAYSSILKYGARGVPEGPLNLRLTSDTQSSRGLAWVAPRDPWLTTVKTARAGFGRQLVTRDPWIAGYRVERREYQTTGGGDWELQGDWEILRNETDGDTGTFFTDSEDMGDKQYVYRVWAYSDWGLGGPGEWVFSVGDPDGDSVQAPQPQLQQISRQDGETAVRADKSPSSNTPPTGLPATSGTPRVGETLTTDTSSIDDADGLANVSYRYQWIAAGSDIAGATGSSYQLTSSEQGKMIRVRVTFTDDAGNKETLTSEATQAVEAAATNPLTGFTVVDTSSQPQTVLGTLRDRGTLTLDDPANGSYGIRVDVEQGTQVGSVRLQLSGGKSVDHTEGIFPYSLYGDEGEGALNGRSLPVGNYTLTATAYSEGGLRGDRLGTLTVSFTVEAANTPPTGLPATSGTPRVGETLTTDTSSIDDADGLANVSYRYQWIAAGSDIAGATGSSYQLTSSEQGKTIRVRVTFTDDAGNKETLTSEATQAVEAAATNPLTGFTVVDASSQPQTVIAALTDGVTLTLDDPANGSYGIRVDIEQGAKIGSVRLQLSGGKSVDHTEGIFPYSLYGDGGAGALNGQSLPVGSYTLTATAYSEGRLGGDRLGTLTVSFTVEAANSAPTGLPTISGTPRVEQTLTADTSAINDADGLTNVSYEHQWAAGGTDIAGATGSTYELTSSEEGQTIQVRVTFTDDRGNSESLTSEATDAVAAKPIPLTAIFTNVPTGHGGSGTTFTFELTFSENVRLSYINLQDHGFTEEGGEVVNVQRKVQGSNQSWTITVKPAGDGAVTITLPETTDCDDQGAICTRDDSKRMLSHSLSFTVPGPGS